MSAIAQPDRDGEPACAARDHVPTPGLPTMVYICAASALVSLVFTISASIGIPFDAAYNLLPFKNLIDEGAFVHRYGDDVTPFDPVVSTGPPVNAPIALAYAVSRKPESLFAATACTVAFYWALFLGAFFVLERERRAVPALLLLVALLARNRFALEQGLFFSAYGELPSFALVLAAVASSTMQARWRNVLAALLLGLAILTKTAVAIGLLLPAAAVAWSALHAARERAPRVIKGSALLAIVLAPMLVWKVALPCLTLTDGELRTYLTASRARAGFERDVALGDAIDAIRGLASAGQIPDTTSQSWSTKLVLLDVFWGDSMRSRAWLVVALLATAWSVASPRNTDRAAGVVGLFGFGTLGWWLLANRLGWYRHLVPVDLAFSVVVVHATFSLSAARGDETSVRRTCAALLYLVAFVAGATGKRADVEYARVLADGASDKRLTTTLAGQVRDLITAGATLYTVGWYQAPQIQVLTKNVFRDIREGAALPANRDRRAYFVSTPQTLAVERTGDATVSELRAAAVAVVFDEGGYALWQLDLEKIAPTARSTPH